MSFDDCITNASFTAGERYVYWNVLQTGFWDRERLCVLKHKLAYCITTMRTWAVIPVYWPDPFKGHLQGCVVTSCCDDTPLPGSKKKEFSKFLISCCHCSQKRDASSQFCVPAVTELFMILFPSQFPDSIGPDKGSFFFCCVDSTVLVMWKRLSSHIQISVSVDPENGCSTFPCPRAQTRLLLSPPGSLMVLNNHGS